MNAAIVKGKPCLNSICEWHDAKTHTCRLFPGDFGFLECKHRFDKPTTTKNRKGDK